MKFQLTKTHRHSTALAVLCLSIIFFATFATAMAKSHHPQATSINGSWATIKQVMAGKDLPATAYNNYILTVTDSIYTYGRPDIDRGTLTYNNGKMDIYGKTGANKGKHYMAIYKMENGQLFICYNLTGSSYPTSFDTQGQPTWFLSVFSKLQQ